MQNKISKFNLPNLGFGIGLRPAHYSEIINGHSNSQWFEIISENFMGLSDTEIGGSALKKLDKVRQDFPILMHGVSLSIGGVAPINFSYLKKLKALAKHIEPAWISDHLCWTGVHGQNLHDLLPLPYTEETLNHICSRINIIQDYIERPLILENVSSYLEFSESELTEWQFVSEIARTANCGILCDLNNIIVSAHNHGHNPYTYIDTLPSNHVVQYHLAGPSQKGALWIDTHDHPVLEETWKLYQYALQRIGLRSTMIEWDANIPPLEVVENELSKARRIHSDFCKTFKKEVFIDGLT